MKTLFDIPEQEKILPFPGRKCRHCSHYYKHDYGTMHYCEMYKQARTAYGNLKVKGNADACELYKPKS